jgi:hypothetical protein
VSNATFYPDDKWDGLVLKARGNLYLTDWSDSIDYGYGYLPATPEIEVRQVIEEGGSRRVGVLGDSGIFDVDTSQWPKVKVITVAGWKDIEIVPTLEIK